MDEIIQGLIGENDKIPYLISLCKQEFLIYTNRDEVSDAALPIIVSMVLQKYNKLGVEGLSGTNFNGVSESYLDGYDSSTIAALNKFRKLKLL